MSYDPERHHRRSIRLPGYDYSQAGAYFVTLVAFQRACLFGEIKNGVMQLSPMGQIADEHWRAIPDHFPHVTLGAYVVMPNHVHGIIIIHDGRDTPWRVPTGDVSTGRVPTNNREQFGKPVSGSLATIIRQYKSSVTQRIRKELDHPWVWQKNYYEHILRNDEDHERIHRYIEANIANWVMDDENPLKTG